MAIALRQSILIAICISSLLAGCGGGGGGKSGNAFLASLTVSGPAPNLVLTPTFSQSINAYTVTVPWIVDVATIRGDAAHPGATVNVEGSGSNIDSVFPNVGTSRPFEVIVTAANGSRNTYTVTIELLPSDTADLSNIVVNGVELDQPFNPQTTTYTATVGFVASSVSLQLSQVFPSTVNLNGDQFEVNGVSDFSDPIALNEGDNDISILVTAQDGTTVRTYTVTITRQAAGTFAQQVYLKSASPSQNDNFGHAVSMFGDFIAIGAPFEKSLDPNDPTNNAGDMVGAVYVFKHEAGIWSQEAYLKPSDISSLLEFGYSLSGSGSTLAVGAPSFSGGGGKVYVFQREVDVSTNAVTWTESAILTGSNTEFEDGFGAAVAVDYNNGLQLAVGASDEDSDGSSEGDNSAPAAGAAYIFRQDPLTDLWTQEAYLKASNANTGDLFGTELSMSGADLAVGAIGESSNGIGGESDNSAPNSGAAYVFTRSSIGVWSQQEYLKSSNTETGDLFGSAIAISNDSLAVGARREDSSAAGGEPDNSEIDAGAVYVFTRNMGIWSQQAFVKSSNAETQDQFGGEVTIDLDTLIVGAVGEDSDGTNGETDNSAPSAGAAYIFTRVGGAWSQERYVKTDHADADDRLGSSLGVSGAILVLGAPGESSSSLDPAANDAPGAGAVYVYQ